MQLQPQPAVESADKNVYVTLGTAVQLHFPVVHVSFVSSAELRPCWFMCSRKEEPLRKRALPCNLRQRNVENPPEVPAGDIDGIMKTNDSHINVSPQFILIQPEVPSNKMFHLLISSVDIRSAFAWLRNNWGFTEVWEWVWNTRGSHTVNFDTLAPRKHVADYRMALLWCFM